MSKQVDNDNVEDDPSFLKTQKVALSSENTSSESNRKHTGKAAVVEKVSFIDRWKTNRFWLVRGTYYVLYSVWMTVIVIAGFIAWLISFLFI